MARRAILILLMIATATYPFIVFFSYNRIPEWLIAIFLCVLILVRATFLGFRNPQSRLLLLCAVLILVGVFIFRSAATLRWYPVMVSLGFLLVFAYSLYQPPTVIERMARLAEPNLPASGVRYTRIVTIVWCVFFVLNALIAAWTIHLNDLKIWTMYNGLISYLLMAVLLVGEWLYRPFYRRRHDDNS